MPYVFRLSDLPKLDLQVDRGTDFEAWKAQWTSYSTLSGLSGESADTQVQALTLCFSRETLTVVNNLGLSAEDRNSVNAIITAIKCHVDGHINESMERRAEYNNQARVLMIIWSHCGSLLKPAIFVLQSALKRASVTRL